MNECSVCHAIDCDNDCDELRRIYNASQRERLRDIILTDDELREGEWSNRQAREEDEAWDEKWQYISGFST